MLKRINFDEEIRNYLLYINKWIENECLLCNNVFIVDVLRILLRIDTNGISLRYRMNSYPTTCERAFDFPPGFQSAYLAISGSDIFYPQVEIFSLSDFLWASFIVDFMVVAGSIIFPETRFLKYNPVNTCWLIYAFERRGFEAALNRHWNVCYCSSKKKKQNHPSRGLTKIFEHYILVSVCFAQSND